MPSPQRTDRAAIIRATIEVMDRAGLDGVSLRAIAQRLSIKQPALYHHFASKADLLDAVKEEILDRRHTARLPREADDWEDFVARNARSMRQAMLSVRDGARLVAAAGHRNPKAATAIAQVSLLERAGFTAPDAVVALIAVNRYTVGCALEQQTAHHGGHIDVDIDEPDSRAAHVSDAVRQVVELGPDHEFETGLAALICGLGRNRKSTSAAASVIR